MKRRILCGSGGALAAALLLQAGARAATLCAPQTGIDVSHWDESVDFARVKAAGYTWAYIKATDGCTANAAYRTTGGGGLRDGYYAQNSAAAAAAGVLWGPYHFFRAYSVESARAQADFFWETIKGTGYTIRPAVDIETYEGQVYAADVRACLRAFCETFEALSGMQPVIYSYTSFINENALAKYFGDYTLWQADYRAARGDTGWGAAAWQFSETGSVPGVTAREVDLDTLYDDRLLMPGVSFSASVVAKNATTEADTGIDAMRALQGKLNRLGLSETLTVDGLSGPLTRAATRVFQRVAGLEADAVWGAQTEAAYQDIAKQPVLRQGSRGAAVRYVQARVGARADGMFGVRTQAAVRAWQSAHGLTADGIVGPRTWAALSAQSGA